jgi:hypothetical protein
MKNEYAADNPATWNLYAAEHVVVSADIGFARDYSVLTLAGLWRGSVGPVVGVTHVTQLPLGTPPDEVVNAVIEMARPYNGKIIWDASNQSAMGALFAARLGRKAVDVLYAASITAASEHSEGIGRLELNAPDVRIAISKLNFSKRELIETVDQMMRMGQLRIGRSDDSDWQVLVDELTQMERRETAAGRITYSAPDKENAHDDAVLSLAINVALLNKISGSKPRRRQIQRRERFSAAAWT